MKALRVAFLLIIVVLSIPLLVAKKPRIAKIAHKFPTDTIIIPESVFSHPILSDTLQPQLIEESVEVIVSEQDEEAQEEIIMIEELIIDEIADEPLQDIEMIDASLSILGESMVDEETMFQFVQQRNPDFSRDIPKAFLEVGRIYGIRGDVALCQAIIETGWFLFNGGTAVTLDQNNFCGLGVTNKGLKGHSFSTVEEGVRAQIQHLFAYATKNRLPEGEKTVDPRFSLVPRGVANSWNDLNNRWAANPNYGESIIKIYRDLLSVNLNDNENR